MKKNFLFILFLALCFSLQAQEICDNAIDDDGDNLIDLNDDDCICTSTIPTSLIPNPSFEERSCCPSQNAQLNCADGWIQASSATTDYVNTCGGYLGNTGIPAVAPLPFPDGDGAVGFRDGQANAGTNYKEYVGSCLTEAMVVGSEYRFDFYVGFQDNVQGSSNFNMAFFGTTSCNNLPFGSGNSQIGCPVNTGQYTQLGELNVSGNNEWVNISLEFIADQAYEVIVLGPSCAPNPNFLQDPYFYVDGLTFAESGAFGTPLESTNGSVCRNDLVLQAPNETGNTYQWYFEGIALLGETNSSLPLGLSDPEGSYLATINNANGCLSSQSYQLAIPSYFSEVEASICNNTPYIIGNQSIDQPGMYSITLEASDGCDSLIDLTLSQNLNSTATFRDTFCRGDNFSFLDITTNTGGSYQTTIPNAAGCDSLINLELVEIDLGLGLILEENISLNLGDSITIIPIQFDPALSDFEWTDEDGNILGDNINLLNYQGINSTYLYLQASSPTGCSIKDSTFVKIVSNYNVFIPNTFSPNGDGFNDFFKFYPSASAGQARRFAIFNRWGALVYLEENIVDFNNFIGWDGKLNNQNAPEDVYVYVLEMEFIDGKTDVFYGDLTLLR